jgi:hypothetical protein
MMPSVCSSHSPPLPLTMAPIPDAPAPTRSLPSSMRSALVHTTTIGTPAELWVSVPGPRGNTVFEVNVVGNASTDGSV